jgi:hypothetical protein
VLGQKKMTIAQPVYKSPSQSPVIMAEIKKRYQTVIKSRKPKKLGDEKLNQTLQEAKEIDR